MMNYLLAFILGYIIGCSNLAYYISKIKKVDLRSAGSGNLGASNTVILVGPVAGVIVGLHDIGKSVVAVILANHLIGGSSPMIIGTLAGVGSVLGHIFPFYLKFKGGKGFASYTGMMIALNWRFGLIIVACAILLTLVTNYIVAGTTFTVVTVPVYLGITTDSLIVALMLVIPTLIIIYKHKDNYVRIFNGTEIGFRGAVKGDHRITKKSGE